MALAAADITEHLMRAAAATQGYLGHQLRTWQIGRGMWIASVDGYEPGMTGVFGLCETGDTEAEALDKLMNTMDAELATDEEDDDVYGSDEEYAHAVGSRTRGEI